jgi:hypothetical protein
MRVAFDWSPRDQNVGETLQHRFSPLIAQEDSMAKDSPVGFGLRLAFLQNSWFEVDLVVRAHRVWQPHLIPAQSRKDMVFWLNLGRQQDEEGMRGGCRQSPKTERFAASSSMWRGTGSNCLAN